MKAEVGRASSGGVLSVTPRSEDFILGAMGRLSELEAEPRHLLKSWSSGKSLENGPERGLSRAILQMVEPYVPSDSRMSCFCLSRTLQNGNLVLTVSGLVGLGDQKASSCRLAEVSVQSLSRVRLLATP